MIAKSVGMKKNCWEPNLNLDFPLRDEKERRKVKKMFSLSRNQPIRMQGRCHGDALLLTRTPKVMKVNDSTLCDAGARTRA